MPTLAQTPVKIPDHSAALALFDEIWRKFYDPARPVSWASAP